MALFNSRKRHDSSQPAPAGTSSPGPEPITAQRVQVSPAPLGAGLRLVSVAAPEATAFPTPAAVPAIEEPRADDLRGLPLGTILYRRGLVEQGELEAALAAGMESGERLGEVLIRRGLVAEEEIGRCLAAQQGLPFLNGEDLTVDPEVLALLPAAEAQELGAVPVSINDGFLLVVRPDPSPQQRGRLEAVLGREVTEAVVSRAVFASLIERVENGGVEAAPLPRPARRNRSPSPSRTPVGSAPRRRPNRFRPPSPRLHQSRTGSRNRPALLQRRTSPSPRRNCRWSSHGTPSRPRAASRLSRSRPRTALNPGSRTPGAGLSLRRSRRPGTAITARPTSPISRRSRTSPASRRRHKIGASPLRPTSRGMGRPRRRDCRRAPVCER